MRYAQTSVIEVERSKADIEFVLKKYNATQFAIGTKGGQSVIVFELEGRKVRMDIPLPDKKEDRFWHTPMRGDRRNGAAAHKAYRQGERAIWRQIYLLIKAKLEAIENKVKTVDEMFLPDLVMKDGKTFKEVAIPAINGKFSIKAPELLGARKG